MRAKVHLTSGTMGFERDPCGIGVESGPSCVVKGAWDDGGHAPGDVDDVVVVDATGGWVVVFESPCTP